MLGGVLGSLGVEYSRIDISSLVPKVGMMDDYIETCLISLVMYLELMWKKSDSVTVPETLFTDWSRAYCKDYAFRSPIIKLVWANLLNGNFIHNSC